MNGKIIIIPGAFDLVKNYGGYPGIDIWLGESKKDEDLLAQADWIFAASSGPNYYVLSSPALNKQKLIFLNPLVKRRTLFSLLIRCIRFMLSEKVGIERLIPPPRWMYGFKKLCRLIKNLIHSLPLKSFLLTLTNPPYYTNSPDFLKAP